MMGKLERKFDLQKVEQVLANNRKIAIPRSYPPTDPKPACTRWPSPPYREKLEAKRLKHRQRTTYATTGR
jgi:hypothetical protein